MTEMGRGYARIREVSHRTVFLHNGVDEEAGTPEEVFSETQSCRCRAFSAAI
tara:strand:+ start:505 stop:660 length:156 start_codon:yes stop_codon:yes gene_type:complete